MCKGMDIHLFVLGWMFKKGNKMGIDLKDFTSAFQHDARGAGGTRAKALQTFRSLQKFAKSARWGDTTPQNITSKQLNGYLTHRATANSARGKPLSARSVQNEAAILRTHGSLISQATY